MVCTAISKALLLRKVVQSFCKHNGYHLTESNVFILFCVVEIWRTKKRSATITDINEFLKRTKRTYATNRIAEYLNKLISYDLLTKEGQYPARYSPNVTALNSIYEMERKLRLSRTDK